MADVELVALCDLDRATADQMARRYHVEEVYTHFAKMLEATQPDFVDVITRPDSHYELVKLAAEREIDIICQKPLAPTFEDAERLVATARQHRVRLMVHENFRFQPWHREVHSLIENGVIGDTLHTITCLSRMGDGWQEDAYLSRQPYFRTMPQLLIYETGVHFIDTFRYLAGEIDGVYADLRQLNHQIAGEDSGFVLLEFASGARGTWNASRYHEPNCEDPRYTFGEFLFEGNGGSIRLDASGRLTVQPLGQPQREHPYEHAKKNFSGDCVYRTQRHFVESLLSGRPFETSGEEYLKTLRVQQAVYQSAGSRLPVRGLAGGGHDADH